MDDTVGAAGDMKFGESLRELETIVESLEAGELDLEESMALYDRGVGLLKACQAKLADAQQKVTMLMGELETDDPTEIEDH
jgi:exodeoxyribonuclease VII small subunit